MQILHVHSAQACPRPALQITVRVGGQVKPELEQTGLPGAVSKLDPGPQTTGIPQQTMATHVS